MQPAIRTQRMARNLPCWKRYVLQVSQMIFDTLPMVEWTGSALVNRYCTRPNAAPMRHMAMPKYIKVTPPTPHKPVKVTRVRSGILMLASLATPALAKPSKQNIASGHDLILEFLIVDCVI